MTVMAHPTWLRSADHTPYPPEPWYLGGSFLLSIFRLPVKRLPALALEAIPADHSLVKTAGYATVGVSFVHYTEGGVLAYEELLVALLVHRGIRLRSSIPDIWVTSPNSMHGGRELWGIPKQMGAFEREINGPSIRTTMSIEGKPVAHLDARVGRKLLPGFRQMPLSTAQFLDGRRIVSINRIVGHLHGLRASWSIDSNGPLDYLAEATPTLSIAIIDAAVMFGIEVERPKQMRSEWTQDE
jgi:hypothetical protein